MEAFLGLLALIYGLGLPVAVLWLIIDRVGIRRRLTSLETRMVEISRGAGTGPAPAVPSMTAADEVAAEPVSAPVPSPPPPSTVPPSPPQPPITADVTQQEIAAGAVPARIVFRGDRLAALGDWLRDNWFLAAAAVSLVLSGVFLVQYGIEQGYLTPAMRALGAVVLGLALIIAGETLRRRLLSADAQIRDAMAAALGGAGIVSIFTGVLAARQLYGLIGAETAFAGLALTAALAVLLGWFHGPFLAIIGLVGGTAAPFLVGGAAEEPFGLYTYFALIAALGLAIDAAKREAWLSVLALGAAYTGAAMLFAGAGSAVWFLGFALGAVAMSAAIPVWSLLPHHEGPTVSGAFARPSGGEQRAWPEFPTRLVAATTLAAGGVAWVVAWGDVAEFVAACAALGVLFAMLALWLRASPALDDLAVLPVLALIAILIAAAVTGAPGHSAFVDWVVPELNPETPPPSGISWLVGGTLAASLAAAWRSAVGRGGHGLWWAALAGVTAPATVIALELFWWPAEIYGAYPWALHAMGVAAFLTLLAGWQNRVADQREMRVSIALTMALTMISLALILWFSFSALTLALAAMVLVAALTDRRFDLAPMGAFIAVGVATLVWRLFLSPGLFWSVESASWPEVLSSHLGVIAALLAARRALESRPRARCAVLLEAGAVLAAGAFASATTMRLLDAYGPDGEYLYASLQGTIALFAALILLRRVTAEPGVALRWLLITLAALAGLIAAGIYALVLVFNPLEDIFGADAVEGPKVFSTLLPAYGLPGVLLIAGPRIARLGWRPGIWAMRILGTVFLAVYVGLEIRHIWRGPDLSAPGVTDPELYSYTVAMMLTAAGLMLAAWKRRSPLLRRLGVVAAAATIAKVFLLDMSGLAGLIRVFSFLGLGLALAGLALVNRWIVRSTETASGPGRELAPGGDGGNGQG